MASILTRTIVADYHTHPTHAVTKWGRPGKYDSFSNEDKDASRFSGLPLFMFNDTGTMKSFQAGAGSHLLETANGIYGWHNAGHDLEGVPTGAPTNEEFGQIRACQAAGLIK